MVLLENYQVRLSKNLGMVIQIYDVFFELLTNIISRFYFSSCIVDFAFFRAWRSRNYFENITDFPSSEESEGAET